MTLKPEMAITTWIVRHAAWTLTRFQVQRARGGVSAYARVFGKAYEGRLAQIGEQVLAYVPQDSSGKGPKHSSKFRDRWIVGTWLGKAEDTDEHLIAAEGGVQRHRTIRRFPAVDPRRWNAARIRALTAAPWDARATRPAGPSGSSGSSGGGGAGAQPLTGQALVKDARGMSVASRSLEGFHGTAGCAACSRRGEFAHGFHHSLVCRQRKLDWARRQHELSTEPQPAMEIEQTRHRIVGKTPAESSYQKREAETAEPEESTAKRAILVEMLEAEVNDLEEASPWEGLMPGWTGAAVRAGDEKELKGLLQQEVFEQPTAQEDADPTARIIDTVFVRKEKNEEVKSRLVVRDIKKFTHYRPEELYAATPAETTMRVQLAVESATMHQDPEPRVIMKLDISQAFVHASVGDEKVYIRLPQFLHRMPVQIGDRTEILDATKLHLLRKALYGYRKS